MGGIAVFVVGGVLVTLLGTIAIVIVPARTERNDETGTKVYSKYLLAVVFFFLFSGLFSAYGITSSLTSLMGNQSSRCTSIPSPMQQSFGSSSGPIACVQTAFNPVSGFGATQGTRGDVAARGVVLYGILLLISISVVWMHGHSAARLFSNEANRRGPPGRVLDAYFFSVAFVALVIFALAAVGAIYSIFGAAGPGTFGAAGSVDSARQIISNGVLAVLADVLLFWHVRHAWRFHAAEPPGGETGSAGAGSAGAGSAGAGSAGAGAGGADPSAEA